MSRLFLLFAIVPFMELYVLIQVGSELGLFTTIGLVMLTAGIGAYLARSQGLEVLARIQAETAAGHTPTDSLLDGACILLAGLLLLTPGFITDSLGLCLLFPPTRMAIRGWLGKNMASAFASHPNGFGQGNFGQGGFHFGGHGGQGDQAHHDAYDATFTSTGESGTYTNASNASGGQEYRGGSDTTVYNGTGSEAPRNPFGNGMRVVMHTTTIGPDGQRVSNTRTFQGGNPFQGMNIDPENMTGTDDGQGPRKTVIIDSKPIDSQK